MASPSFERDSAFFILVAFITFDILLVSLTAGSITIFLYLKVGLPAIHSVIEPAAYKKSGIKSHTNGLPDSQKASYTSYKCIKKYSYVISKHMPMVANRVIFSFSNIDSQ